MEELDKLAEEDAQNSRDLLEKLRNLEKKLIEINPGHPFRALVNETMLVHYNRVQSVEEHLERSKTIMEIQKDEEGRG